jgi:hypothetical protein
MSQNMNMIKLSCRNSILLFLIIISINLYSQKQDRIWLFADSAGIDFNDLSNPVPINCNISEPCFLSFSSIANNQGQLLFYVAGIDLSPKAVCVFDKNGNPMLNGDTLIGDPFVGQGCMIIPFSSDTNKYYVFVSDRNGAIGNSMHYSIVDMSLNGGLGSLISRDNLLLPDHVNEKLNAVKHANGRDWWVIVQSCNTDSLFHKFLISNDTILGPYDQFIGSGNNRDKWMGQMIFSKDGSKVVVAAENATLDIFDFDRCSGELYNYRAAGEGVFSEENAYFGCSISPDGKVLYTSSDYPNHKNVYQYDLTSNNIISTKQTIISIPDTGVLHYHNIGQHLLGPDNRIYVMRGTGFHGIDTDNYYTHHMDVILQPNLLGTSCNFQLFYFDLGRGRNILGLPTMLNYNLGPVSGSVCDSLYNGIEEEKELKDYIEIFPNPFENIITIHSLYSITGKIIIQDELGKIIFIEKFEGNKSFDTSFLNKGVYVVKVETSKQVFFERMIKINY